MRAYCYTEWLLPCTASTLTAIQHAPEKPGVMATCTPRNRSFRPRSPAVTAAGGAAVVAVADYNNPGVFVEPSVMGCSGHRHPLGGGGGLYLVGVETMVAPRVDESVDDCTGGRIGGSGSARRRRRRRRRRCAGGLHDQDAAVVEL